LFDGEGARLRGGRWNSPGRRVIYAASSYAGAMLEILVQTGRAPYPRRHVAISIAIPIDVAIEEVDVDQVPGWDGSIPGASRLYGDDWLQSARTCILLVPSAVVRPERNVMINQDHPDFAKLTASEPEPVVWDRRLFRR
jgi:RES domain-containing protein